MNDLISRHAALDALTEYWKGISDRHPILDGEMAVYADCKGIIKRLSSAQPDLSEYSDKLWRKAYERGKRDALVEPQWIQCSERLPEMNRSILIANSQGWTAEGEYVGEYDGHRKWVQYRWSATLWDDEVLAWMPLPDPYKGEQK